MAHVHINKLALLATLLVAVAAAFCVVGVASVSENWALIQAKSKDLHTTADLAKLGTLKFKTFHYSPLNIDSQTYTYEKSEISEIQGLHCVAIVPELTWFRLWKHLRRWLRRFHLLNNCSGAWSGQLLTWLFAFTG